MNQTRYQKMKGHTLTKVTRSQRRSDTLNNNEISQKYEKGTTSKLLITWPDLRFTKLEMSVVLMHLYTLHLLIIPILLHLGWHNQQRNQASQSSAPICSAFRHIGISAKDFSFRSFLENHFVSTISVLTMYMLVWGITRSIYCDWLRRWRMEVRSRSLLLVRWLSEVMG